MNTSVRDQIRNHYKAVDTSQETVGWAEIVARLDTDASPVAAPRRSRRTAVWVAVAAAVVTILLIGVIPLLVNNQETPPAATIVPTTLAESTPTTLGELVLTPGTWSRVPHDETNLGGPGKQSMSDVTVGGPGLVAVGASESEAAVWTSADGVAWSRVPHDEDVFGGPDEQYMNSVTAGGPGFVAVGIDFSGNDPDAAVWTSVDGITWSRVPHDESVFGGTLSQEMNSVTVGGPGLVAVGFDGGHDHMDGSGIEDLDAAVWTSVDGLTWSRVPADDSVFGGPDNQAMQSVTVGGSGLVAVGYDGENDWFEPPGDAAVWTSVDGMTWSRVPHDESVFGVGVVVAMHDVTVGGPGLVAVGIDLVAPGYHPSNLGVWTSVDGLNWSRIPHDEEEFRGGQSVTAGGPGLVAVGNGVWVSANGTVWSQVPDDNGRFGDVDMTSVTVGGPGFVAVGIDFSGDDSDAAVWVSLADD
jgi:hypothetical protein